MNNYQKKYLGVPEERIIALQRRELDDLSNFQEDFRFKWKQEEKCSCVIELKENELPWCEHLRKELKSNTKEQEDKIWEMTMAINYESFSDKKRRN